MKYDKKFAVSIVLSIVGIMILILVFIIKSNTAEWILVSLILLIISLVIIVKRQYNRSRPIAVFCLIIFFIIMFEMWGFVQIIFYSDDYL